MTYISIDPGKFKVAYALWSDQGVLVKAGLVQLPSPSSLTRVAHWARMGKTVWEELNRFDWLQSQLICEVPQVYEGHKETDDNDLIDLAGVLGSLATYWPNVIWCPTPREWKGQLPKEITQKRVDQKLSDEEKKRIIWPSKSLRHNTYDAIHLGLTYLEKKGLRKVKG